jgi:hypothetical protein
MKDIKKNTKRSVRMKSVYKSNKYAALGATIIAMMDQTMEEDDILNYNSGSQGNASPGEIFKDLSGGQSLTTGMRSFKINGNWEYLGYITDIGSSVTPKVIACNDVKKFHPDLKCFAINAQGIIDTDGYYIMRMREQPSQYDNPYTTEWIFANLSLSFTQLEKKLGVTFLPELKNLFPNIKNE